MRESLLVVGGAGYIGSHTAKLLHKQGYEPIVLDNLSTGHQQASGTFMFYEGGFEDSHLVEKIIRKHKISTVMHFGAKALVGESVEDPLLYYSSNVSGTLKLLSAMLAAGAKTFIFSSTCATYGNPGAGAISEDIPQKPINPYGQSKLFVETILKDLHTAYGLQYAVLRYFNASGCDPDGVLGEDHRPETHLIPRALAVPLGREPKLLINGNDYETSDGSCIRDYVHVNDLAQAHIKAMQLIGERKQSFDFNLGSERGYSVFEVLKSIERVTGKTVTHEIGSRRPGDPPVLVADSTRARGTLGWKCEYDLDAIVRTAYNWMERHPDGYGK